MRGVRGALVVFAVMTGIVGAAVPGICNGPPSQANFNSFQIGGVWYEIGSNIPLSLFPCSQTVFLPETNNDLTIITTGLTQFGFLLSTTFRAVLISPQHPGTYSVFPFQGLLGEAIWRFIDTDYNNYAVVFVCRDILGPLAAQNVRIFSRRQDGLPDSILASVYSRLSAAGVDTSRLVPVSQDCHGFHSPATNSQQKQ